MSLKYLSNFWIFDGNHIPNNSSSSKYKSSLITNRNGLKKAVPLKLIFGDR